MNSFWLDIDVHFFRLHCALETTIKLSNAKFIVSNRMGYTLTSLYPIDRQNLVPPIPPAKTYPMVLYLLVEWNSLLRRPLLLADDIKTLRALSVFIFT